MPESSTKDMPCHQYQQYQSGNQNEEYRMDCQNSCPPQLDKLKSKFPMAEFMAAPYVPGSKLSDISESSNTDRHIFETQAATEHTHGSVSKVMSTLTSGNS